MQGETLKYILFSLKMLLVTHGSVLIESND